MADVRVVPDYAGIREFIETDPGLDAEVRRFAERGAAYARQYAPVGSPADDDEHPGQYRASILTERIPDGPGWSFGASDQKAHWIEYGARNMPRRLVMTRAAEALTQA